MLKWFKLNRCTVWPVKDCHGNKLLAYFSSFQWKIFRIVQPECRCWRFLGPLRTCCRQKRQGQTLSPTSSICTGESPGRAVLRIRIHEIWSVESSPDPVHTQVFLLPNIEKIHSKVLPSVRTSPWPSEKHQALEYEFFFFKEASLAPLYSDPDPDPSLIDHNNSVPDLNLWSGSELWVFTKIQN